MKKSFNLHFMQDWELLRVWASSEIVKEDVHRVETGQNSAPKKPWEVDGRLGLDRPPPGGAGLRTLNP